jgi:four helix bundle protein
MDLAPSVYQVTSAFPSEERYGLTAQLRRGAVSIPSNIAEGQGRSSEAEFVRFLRIAHGSLREVETQLLLSKRLKLADADEVENVLELCGEVGRLLNGLNRSMTQ